MRGRPVADGVAWPIPSISGAHAHYAYNSTAHAPCIAGNRFERDVQMITLAPAPASYNL